MMSSNMKPGSGVISPIAANMAHGPESARRNKRTYYVSDHRCAIHGMPFRWLNTGECMACQPEYVEVDQ